MSLNPIPSWFLRHGETVWNAQAPSQGATDIALNQVAWPRRGAARARWRAWWSRPSSPRRSPARVTAEIVAETLRLPVRLDPDLREVGFGEQEDQPMGDRHDDRIAGRRTLRGAENFAALRARAVAAINRATALPGPVLVAAHGALWRAFRREARLPRQ